jgi:hypothetical protein
MPAPRVTLTTGDTDVLRDKRPKHRVIIWPSPVTPPPPPSTGPLTYPTTYPATY